MDLPTDRVATLHRAETLSRKVNLLLDVIMSPSGEPFEYTMVRDIAQEKTGYFLSRTRWSMLKQGRPQVVTEGTLRAVAAVFSVDAGYLLNENGNVPEQVQAELELLRSMRRSEVRDFAVRALGPVDPEAMRAIAKILDEQR
jgi:transcriptional regulator with XRE-family HTH domain